MRTGKHSFQFSVILGLLSINSLFVIFVIEVLLYRKDAKITYYFGNKTTIVIMKVSYGLVLTLLLIVNS